MDENKIKTDEEVTKEMLEELSNNKGKEDE